MGNALISSRKLPLKFEIKMKTTATKFELKNYCFYHPLNISNSKTSLLIFSNISSSGLVLLQVCGNFLKRKRLNRYYAD